MKYVSTRRFASAVHEGVTFEDAILQGYAPDGGLFVPQTLPTITAEELQSWSSLSYAQLTFQVLRKFISSEEIPNDSLERLCVDAFQKDWYHANVIPVVPLKAVLDHETESISQNTAEQSRNFIYVSELFHGPTHCFKDLGMIMMILLLNYFATKHQKKVILLVSTTGDTGPAAVHAVRRLSSRGTCGDGCGDKSSASRINVIVHFPKSQISKFQRLQLTTQICYPQVTVVSFEGGGDDMDAPIKNILTELRKQSNTTCDRTDNQTICTGVNSYNIARPLMQAVHFVSTSIISPHGEQCAFTINYAVHSNILLVVAILYKVWTYLRVIEKHGDTGDPGKILK
jgi:threonine synthase